MSITSSRWGALPAYRLQAPSGATALITLYGAHLVEWISADGQSHLFCSEQSACDGSKAIRGGVPLIFPQFAAQGKGMRHGFARVSQWRLVAPEDSQHDVQDSQDQPCRIEFELTHADLDASFASAWPHAFALRWQITLSAQSIELHFSVENRGSCDFDFASALHSYWAVAHLADIGIHGLQHLYFDDQTITPAATHQELAGTLHIANKIDRIYHGSIAPLQLRTSERQLQLEQGGFCNTVVWNPGAQDAMSLSDMADEEFQRFVCIEAAHITPIKLAAGEKWQGWQRVEASVP